MPKDPGYLIDDRTDRGRVKAHINSIPKGAISDSPYRKEVYWEGPGLINELKKYYSDLANRKEIAYFAEKYITDKKYHKWIWDEAPASAELITKRQAKFYRKYQEMLDAKKEASDAIVKHYLGEDVMKKLNDIYKSEEKSRKEGKVIPFGFPPYMTKEGTQADINELYKPVPENPIIRTLKEAYARGNEPDEIYPQPNPKDEKISYMPSRGYVRTPEGAVGKIRKGEFDILP